MKMKKKEKRMIAILIAITVVVIIIGIVMGINNSKKAKQETEGAGAGENVVVEEFVQVLDDGTKLNTSSKLQETKTIDGMEVSNFQLTEKDNETLLLGTVTNVSSETRGGYPVDIKIVDKEGNEIGTIGGLIPELEPGQSTDLISSSTLDYANAYDFTITKK